MNNSGICYQNGAIFMVPPGIFETWKNDYNKFWHPKKKLWEGQKSDCCANGENT